MLAPLSSASGRSNAVARRSESDDSSPANSSAPASEAPEETIEDLILDGAHRLATARCAAEHGPSVGRLCMAMLGTQEEADEVAQETFLAAYRGMSKFRAEGSVRAWLFGIARRQCARRLQRGPRRHMELVEADHSGTESTELALRGKRRSSALLAQLGALKPSEREVLLLRFAGDLSFKEVAAQLDLSEATARKRTSRALLRLRDRLQREDME